MHFKSILAVTALSGLAAAQDSLCDKYTKAVLKNNTAENQATLLAVLVNTVVIGNYTYAPGVKAPPVAVPGILANGTVDGVKVNLLPYFNGGLASSNRGGNAGVAVNFLDDGGAVPLMLNKPANGTSSNQYKLLTHLYEYFGQLLNCSQQTNTSSFKPYAGQPSQYQVHKFMNLNEAQVKYFITQVGTAAVSLGVTVEDATAVGMTLTKVFNVRCAPAAAVIPQQGVQNQSICAAESCPPAPNSVCPAEKAVEPGVANSTLAMGLGNASSTATGVAPSGSSTPTGSGTAAAGTSTSKALGAIHTVGPVAALAGAAALVFAL